MRVTPRRQALCLAALLLMVAGLASNGAHARDALPSGPGVTYIHEFPHPDAVVHYHPRAGQQLRLADVRYALEQGCHGLELDLHMREGEVVCNHDGPTAAAPRLTDALRLLARYRDRSPSVQRDGRQFFLVLEPKVNDPALFDSVAAILGRFEPLLSTAVGPDGGPRPVTVVITGAHLSAFASRSAARPDLLNRLCILENRDYAGQIVSRTPGRRFQWTALPYPRHRGRVEALHAGTDPALPGRYSVRVWGTGDHLEELLESGVDSINCDHEQVPGFVALVRGPSRRMPLVRREGPVPVVKEDARAAGGG